MSEEIGSRGGETRRRREPENGWRRRPLVIGSMVLGCALLLSLFTVFIQVKVAWPDYFVRGEQLRLHRAVLAGKAGNPWQYRVLPELCVEAAIRFIAKTGLPRPTTIAFIAVRLLQNVLLFVLAFAYYRRLGLDFKLALVALSLLAYSMTHSLYDSDLQFNTYGDVTFYLAAGLIVLSRRYLWIVPLTCLAALNRETSGLMPFLVLAEALALRPRALPQTRLLLVAGTALAAYAIIFVVLRHIYGPQELITAYGNRPGLPTLRYNLFRPQTWIQLFGTLGVFPILAVASIRQWSAALRGLFWVMVPIWCLVHPFTSIMAESRLFLVPMALVFLPGALLGVAAPRFSRSSDREDASRSPSPGVARSGTRLAGVGDG
jgi:hypothetical protein